MDHPIFRSLDHIAIVVDDTERALKTWRDRLGLKVLFSEEVNGGTIRLTHLDVGNTQLQIVEPLTREHPLNDWLEQHGPGLHHLCFSVADVKQAGRDLAACGVETSAPPHQGTQGKRALFFDASTTDSVTLEVTGDS